MNEQTAGDIMRTELQRLEQWFRLRLDRPGSKSQVIHIGMALDAANREDEMKRGGTFHFRDTPSSNEGTERASPDPALERLALRAAEGRLNPGEYVDAAAKLGSALLKSTQSATRASVLKECAELVEAEARACEPGSDAAAQNWPFALTCVAGKIRRLIETADSTADQK